MLIILDCQKSYHLQQKIHIKQIKTIIKYKCFHIFSIFKIHFIVFLFNNLMEIGVQQSIKVKGLVTKHEIGSSKQKFESDDSQGSDLSYESSLTDEQDNNIGRIQFFKQEMARFFINYPQLINKNIIEEVPNYSQKNIEDDKQDRINRNWQAIADQILNQAKQSSTSLQSLAKRISLYRYKIDQSDLIELLLQQKNFILKQIDAEITQKNTQTNLIGRNQKNLKHVENQHAENNGYYSWVNQKIFKSKYIDKGQPKKPYETQIPTKRNISLEKTEKNKTVQRFTKSLHKTVSIGGKKIRQSSNTQHQNRYESIADSNKPKNEALDESQITQNKLSRDHLNWRHLTNFQPKTQIGKQLCEQIKKNSYNDQLGIKKTIINFLSNYKEMINNQIINKVTLSQKIQKLYNDDAKQLLMFYPSKVNSFDNNLNLNSSFKQNSQQDKFIKLLKQINQGPLMKYWRQLQQNKL